MKTNILVLTMILTISLQVDAQTISLEDTNWRNNGPYCAYVKSLALAPSNPNVLYLGTYSSGIYKTINKGDSWTLCSTVNLPIYKDTLFNDPLLHCWYWGDYYPIDAIAVHPHNENKLWIGTLGRGLYESSNGGESWQKANKTLPDTLAVNIIHINPENPDDILLGTGKYFMVGNPSNGGLYRTMDGGNTWYLMQDIPNGSSFNISDIVRDPSNNDHIIVSISSAGEPGFAWGIMESYDNGTTWQELFANTFNFYNLSINPENNQNLWSSVYTNFQEYWLMYSNDGGQNWNLYEGFEEPYKWVSGLFTDTDFNLYIKRRSQEPDFSFDILKSADNGASWTGVDQLIGKTYLGWGGFKNRVHSEHSNPENIYFSNNYGVYYSENGGETTQVRNTDLMNCYVLDLEANPKNNDRIYAAGLQGLWKSMDAGQHWQNIIREKIRAIKCDPKHPDTIYFGGRNLWRSFDGGDSYQKIAYPLFSTLVSIAVHPQKTNIVYYQMNLDGITSIYKSFDYGSNWELVFSCDDLESYREIVIDPNHPDTLYIGRHRSLNGGDTWEEAFDKKIIAVHPFNSNILYATEGSYVNNTLEVSYDWGNTFQTLAMYQSGPFPGEHIYCFRLDTENPDYLFYSTRNNNVFYSMNAGENWQQLSGHYNRRVMDIIPYVNENKFYLATHGNGVWVYDTTAISNSHPENNYNALSGLKVSPNPFSDDVTIHFTLTSSGPVNASIYNLQGSLINTLTNEYKTKGTYKVIWNGTDKNKKEVNSGLYFIRLISGRNVYTQKVVFIQ